MKHANGEELHAFFRSLYGAWQALSEVDEAIHSACGMTGAQKKNIGHLLEGGPMTVSDLAYARGVSRQSVQVAMNSLVELGYVRLINNPRHKTARLVEVTPLGLGRFRESQETEHRIIEQAFPEMDAGEVATAARVLQQVRERLKELPPDVADRLGRQ